MHRASQCDSAKSDLQSYSSLASYWKATNTRFSLRDTLESMIGSIRLWIEDESSTSILEGVPVLLSLSIN
jgi:hypothetical protein